MMIPAMEKEGYSRKFAAAVTAASSIIGPIIPPSIMSLSLFWVYLAIPVGSVLLLLAVLQDALKYFQHVLVGDPADMEA